LEFAASPRSGDGLATWIDRSVDTQTQTDDIITDFQRTVEIGGNEVVTFSVAKMKTSLTLLKSDGAAMILAGFGFG
jgi:hypothetical protein